MTHTRLFAQIEGELTAGGITGWCPVPKAQELAATVLALRPVVTVELGVWGGRSLLPMAMACQHVGHGIVLAVDPWNPHASTQGYDAPNAAWWGQQDHEAVYQGFVAHLARLGLNHRVGIQRAPSDEAPLPDAIDLLHIDGQHSEQAVRDVQRWAPRVRLGGIVCMDDLGWTVNGIPHVAHAVRALLDLGFAELHRTETPDGTWGFFQRTSLPANYAAKAKKRS